MTIRNIQRNTKGFTLFYAVLVSSLLLSIAIATFNISFKNSRLVAGSVDSQEAFYAADTGLECALYWDVQQKVFSGIAENPIVTCNGGESIIASEIQTNVWQLSLTDTGGVHCATVDIDKSVDGATVIESRGYNTCSISDERRVERGMRATY
jgi:Tfp pilus assembly protein PilX